MHESTDPTRRLRLLIISQNFPQLKLAWAGEFLIRQARFLTQHGIDTSFLVPRPWAPWPLYYLGRWRIYGPENPLLQIDGVEVRRVDFVRPPGFYPMRHEARLMRGPVLRSARAWNRQRPFDLVMGVQMNGEAPAAVRFGREFGIPVATMAIGTDVTILPDRVPGLWEKLAETMRGVDLPIVVSKELGRRLSIETSVEYERHRVTATVVKLPFFDPERKRA